MYAESLVCGVAFVLSMLLLLPSSSFADIVSKGSSNDSNNQKDADSSLKEAAAASKSWLDLVDNNNYGKSWEEASALMKLTIHEDEWIALLNKTRKPLGRVISRQVLDQRTAKNPHGLPQGSYMVMFYKTEFTNKPSAYELVTLFLEDGEWRVITYQVD